MDSHAGCDNFQIWAQGFGTFLSGLKETNIDVETPSSVIGVLSRGRPNRPLVFVDLPNIELLLGLVVALS